MADPQTPTIQIYQPTRGSDAGVWDSPVNANSGAIDSLFGNVANIGLSNAPVTLTTPPNSGAAWAGPYQSQSALLNLTGAITANCVITIPRAGYFIVWNQCTSGGIGAGSTSTTNYVQLTTGVGGGGNIGVPFGKKCHVFSDGTNLDFVNVLDAGTKFDLMGATALPSWMTACTVLPYLIRDGSIYNVSAYPALASVLGNVFGGTLGVTFAVPDSRARTDVAYDTNTNGGPTNRLTTAVSGVNGQTMASAGGDQNMPTHTHTATVNDPGHTHTYTPATVLNASGGAGADSSPSTQHTGSSTTGITVTNANAGTGVAANVQPTIVSFLPLIKT